MSYSPVRACFIVAANIGYWKNITRLQRDKLASIVHEVEEQGPVKLTRRGKPIAVLISESDYERLAGRWQDFWSAVEQFRATHDLDALNVTDIDFQGVRDKSPGRDFQW